MSWTWMAGLHQWRQSGVPFTWGEGCVAHPPDLPPGFFGVIRLVLDSGGAGYNLTLRTSFNNDSGDVPWNVDLPTTGTLYLTLEPRDPDSFDYSGNPAQPPTYGSELDPLDWVTLVDVEPDPEPDPEPEPPDFLRHASRHVHHTVARRVKDGLTQLNWMTPDSTPLGAPVVTFQTEPVITSGRAATKIQAGLVSVTLGNEVAPEPQELGGPLSLQEYPIFVDVFGNTEGETTALACDIRDILLGRFEFSSRFLHVVDQSLGTDVDGWLIELDDVERASPDNTFAVYWQVVKATASTYYPEVAY